MPPIGDPAAFAAEAYKSSKKAPEKPAAGVPASDGAFVATSTTNPDAPEVPPGEAAAAQSMMSAMQKKDAAGMARAMRDFIEICYPSLGAGEAEAGADTEEV